MEGERPERSCPMRIVVCLYFVKMIARRLRERKIQPPAAVSGPDLGGVPSPASQMEGNPVMNKKVLSRGRNSYIIFKRAR